MVVLKWKNHIASNNQKVVNCATEYIDLTGKRFGLLTVIARVENYKNVSGKKVVMRDCLCDCGNRAVVRSTDLKKGALNYAGVWVAKGMECLEQNYTVSGLQCESAVTTQTTGSTQIMGLGE